MDFEQIEDAILARGKQKMTYLRTCETYAGQLEGDLDILIINAPAMFTVYNGGPLEKLDNLNFNDRPTFSLLFLSEDARGKEALRKDANAGCYRMLKDALKEFTNNDLGLDMHPLIPEKIYLSFITQRYACYGITFGTNFDSQYQSP